MMIFIAALLIVFPGWELIGQAETVYELGNPYQIQILAPAGYDLTEYSFTTLPITFLSPDYKGDERGILVKTLENKKEGIQILLPAVSVGDGFALVHCSFYASASPGTFSVGLAALNVPPNQEFSKPGFSLATNRLDGLDMNRSRWQTIDLLYNSPHNTLIPFVQITSESAQYFFIDRLTVTPIHEMRLDQFKDILNVKSSENQPTPTPIPLSPLTPEGEFPNPFDDPNFALTEYTVSRIIEANGDGFPDTLLLTQNMGTGSESFYRWSIVGSGLGVSFGDRTLITQTNANSATTGDFNEDGIDDIILHNYNNTKTAEEVNLNSLFFLSENGSYERSPNPPDMRLVFKTETRDFNGDGHIDILRYCLGNPRTFDLLLGDGHGQFEKSEWNAILTNEASKLLAMRTIDYNNDGYLDFGVVTTPYQTNASSLSLYIGDGKAGFQPGIAQDLETDVSSFCFADLNGDQRMDVAYTDARGQVCIRWQTSDGRLSDPETEWIDSQAVRIEAADLNQDGWLDLVAGGVLGYEDILFGKGQGLFAKSIHYFGGYALLFLIDLNRDSYPDLITERAMALNRLGYGPRRTPSNLAGSFSNPKAVEILNQAIEINKPWLFPKPIEAQYNYSVNGASTTYYVKGGGMTPLRVGSLCVTALHNLAYKISPYKATILHSDNLTMDIEVWFSDRGKGLMQLGGQENAVSLKYDYEITYSVISLDMERMIPLKIVDNQNNQWVFDPDFYSIDGGIAPKRFTFKSRDLNEEQEFQVVDGVWILKNGSVGVKRIELTDFRLIGQ